MTDVDLRTLSPAEVVLHFGGRPNEVDAFTFANSLVAFADALREINSQINTNFSLEVTIEGVGPGSFRAKIGTKLKSITSFFSDDVRSLLINLLASFIYVRVLDPQGQAQIIINDDAVIIQNGADRVIVPRATWDARQALKKPKDIEKHIAKAFEVIEDDTSITEFGLAAQLDSKAPIGHIDRKHFGALAHPSEDHGDKEANPHFDTEARLTVLKLVLERSKRKWQFVWNGIKISASIRDENFFDKLAAREYNFAQGDTLLVTLRVFQIKDEFSGVMLNDKYEVIAVNGQEKASQQTHMFPR